MATCLEVYGDQASHLYLEKCLYTMSHLYVMNEVEFKAIIQL